MTDTAIVWKIETVSRRSGAQTLAVANVINQFGQRIFTSNLAVEEADAIEQARQWAEKNKPTGATLELPAAATDSQQDYPEPDFAKAPAAESEDESQAVEPGDNAEPSAYPTAELTEDDATEEPAETDPANPEG